MCLASGMHIGSVRFSPRTSALSEPSWLEHKIHLVPTASRLKCEPAHQKSFCATSDAVGACSSQAPRSAELTPQWQHSTRGGRGNWQNVPAPHPSGRWFWETVCALFKDPGKRKLPLPTAAKLMMHLLLALSSFLSCRPHSLTAASWFSSQKSHVHISPFLRTRAKA